MINLTFGEQVKIVLSRKGMTIKELAEEVEERTGKKMSRQNLTQRLGRDNFQEQDMRMIADILGCPFQLSILGNTDADNGAAGDGEMPTGRELEKLAEKKEKKAAREELRKNIERDITVGEFVDILEESDAEEPVEEEAQMELSLEEAEPIVDEEDVQEVDEELEAVETREINAVEETEVADSKPEEEIPSEEAEPVEEKKHSPFSKITRLVTPKEEKKSSGWPQDFQPIKRREDIPEDLENGDVNPYTGHEYQSNSVRMHPHRIGYVQVYDRKEHKWTDMTEWAFLGVEERKKAAMGKEYEPPIYLD